MSTQREVSSTNEAMGVILDAMGPEGSTALMCNRLGKHMVTWRDTDDGRKIINAPATAIAALASCGATLLVIQLEPGKRVYRKLRDTVKAPK